MFDFKECKLQSVVVHQVGSQSGPQELVLAQQDLAVDETLMPLLNQYFLSPFKDPGLFTFHHTSDLSLNEAYHYITSLFEKPGSLLENSIHLAKHLHEASKHPNIKFGEFYVAYFEGAVIDGEWVDAIGLFKSENKETYLKVYPQGQKGLGITPESGVNINKLDKGCIVFNTEKEEGYKVVVIDKTNKNGEAQYWKDDFLGLRPREDIYHHTRNYIDMCKMFAEEGFEDVNKIDKIDMVNNTVSYFSKNEQFDQQSFEDEVMQAPELIQAFEDYRTQYQNENDITTFPEFDISKPAVKRSKQFIRSVIKLDKSFHVYVHGNRQNIERGYDETRKQNYYTLYFDHES